MHRELELDNFFEGGGAGGVPNLVVKKALRSSQSNACQLRVAPLPLCKIGEEESLSILETQCRPAPLPAHKATAASEPLKDVSPSPAPAPDRFSPQRYTRGRREILHASPPPPFSGQKAFLSSNCTPPCSWYELCTAHPWRGIFTWRVAFQGFFRPYFRSVCDF